MVLLLLSLVCCAPVRTRTDDQGCQFGFVEAKFVIFGRFSTRLDFFKNEKRPNAIWLFLAT